MCRFPSTRSCLPTSPRAQHQGKHLTLRKRLEDWQRIDSRVYAWVQIQNSNSRSDLGEWHNDVPQHLRVSNRVNRKRSWKKLRFWREVAWSFCYSMFVRDSFLRLAFGFLSFSWTVCHCVCFFTFTKLYQTLQDPRPYHCHPRSPPAVTSANSVNLCCFVPWCFLLQISKFSQIFRTLCLPASIHVQSKVPLFAANKLWRKHLRRSLSISWRSTTSSTCEAVPAWVWALKMRPNDLEETMSTKSKQF